MGTEEKKLTGYPSIDKPWLKYYDEKAITLTIPKYSIYEYLWEQNKDYQDMDAIVYVGRKISYKTLFQNINNFATAFDAEGIKKGDFVTIIAPSIPEIIYSFYALNKIGAICNFVDPRKSLEEVDELLKTINSKAYIVLDDIWEKFYDIIKKYDTHMFSVSIKDSLPIVPKILIGLKTKKVQYSDVITIQELLNKWNNNETEINSVYEEDIPALLEYTGGTTGLSKAVALSNENVNSIVVQTKYSKIPIKRGESWLSIGFPFIAYSLICSLHMPLSLGVTTHLCFDLDIDNVVKNLLKWKINHMANTPLLWNQLIKNKKAQNADLSFIIAPTVGADSLDVTKEEEINDFLKQHNCKYNLAKGYGMTEISSGVCVTHTNEINKIGSVGIPFSLMNVGIFAVDSDEELTYGEQGEICVSGPSIMLGYYNNDEENKAILRKHSDGNVWLHSGDLGHMDKDGFLFVDGRIKRVITDCTGYKIFASMVEKVILEIPDIEKCCVVGKKDKENNVGQIPVAFVVIHNVINKEIIIKNIMEHCERYLPNYAYPRMIIIKEDFPYTAAAKVDYKALENEIEKNELCSSN